MSQPQKRIEAAGLWGGDLILLDSVHSTNRWILENAGECGNGDVVLALRQTHGHGRFQREWLSLPGRSLTLSAALRQADPDAPVTPSICQAAAAAVRDTLEKHGVHAALKWPNDVLAGGRKIAGILAESDPETGLTALGIGININMTAADFAGYTLTQPATSMTMETGNPFDPRRIGDELVRELEGQLARVRTDLAGMLEYWRRHDFLAGREIEILTHTGPIRGYYLGLNTAGHLLLRDASGTIRTFLSGDVSVNP